MVTTAIDAIRAAIEGRLNTEWGATTKVLYANQMKRTMKTSNALPSEFIMLEIDVSDISPVSLGADGDRLYRHSGGFSVHIFTALGEGEGRANELADKLGEIFLGKEFNGVICYRVAPGTGEPGDDEGRYWRKSIRFIYDYDKVL